MKKTFWILLVLLLAVGAVLGQRRSRSGGGGYPYWRGRSYDADTVRTPREIEQHSYETPNWTNEPGFEKDVFTFTRIKRDNTYNRGGRGGWDTDTPDSDLNLSFRLQQMTAIKVDPNGLFLRLSEKELADYPFIYMVEPGSLALRDEEIEPLRNYLLNGGFLMFDDFWGENEWQNVEEEMKKVFPDRTFVELPLSNALYHCVFDIQSKGQVPNVGTGTESQYTGVTWERWDAREVHHRAIFDDKGRIIVLATHNTDNGDGWEWEGNNHYYFEHFAEKIAYPLGINIIFYSMTH